MMHMPNQFMNPFQQRAQHVRAPPTPRAEPLYELAEDQDNYTITVRAPAGFALHDAHASLDQGLLVEGALVPAKKNTSHEYVTRRRAGVYAEPHESTLVGVVPAGQRVKGGAPTANGWIALDDDESWMVDDGSLALVSRPEASRAPTPFAKRVSLPNDAELRRARSQPDGRGGLLVTVPRVRRQEVPMPRKVPVHRKPAAATKPAAPPPKPAAAKKENVRPAASAPKPAAAGGKDAGADAHKAAHKRKVAERRDLAEELAMLRGEDYQGPVLAECASPDRTNVQSPVEAVEEWVATTDGGFVKGEGLVAEVMMEVDAARTRGPFRPVAPSQAQAEEEDLSYYGF